MLNASIAVISLNLLSSLSVRMVGQLNEFGVQLDPKAQSPVANGTFAPHSVPKKNGKSAVSVYEHQMDDSSTIKYDFPPELITVRDGRQIRIRPFRSDDVDALWAVLEPTFRAGETYPQPRDVSKEAALQYWIGEWEHCYVVEAIQSEPADPTGTSGAQEPLLPLIATYSLRTQTRGGGSHVCNAGFVTHPTAQRWGVATAMCTHSMQLGRALGFIAMQFNFVISSNEKAVRLWTSMGFQIVGRLPKAFKHPTIGYVDAFVMYQWL